MRQLYQDLYRSGMWKGFWTDGSRLFGLLDNQTRHQPHKMPWTHNAQWFNADGDKLGGGDLSYNDMVNIAKTINEDELFVVKANSVFDDGIIVRYIIARAKIYVVYPIGEDGQNALKEINGHVLAVLSRNEAAILIDQYAAKHMPVWA